MTVTHGIRVPAQRALAVDAAAAAWCEMAAAFGEAAPHGWGRVRDGVAAMVHGSPVAPLNAVVCGRRGAVASATALLDAVAEGGLPHCLQVRDGDPAADLLARSRGLVAADEVPLMLLDAAAVPAALASAPPAAIRVLGAGELDAHVDALVAGFDVPEDAFASIRGGDVLSRDGVRAYVVEEGGVPVATAMGMTLGAYVGVFSVATVPAYRRRGYGAALTARAIADGAAAGARTALLQSSAAGRTVYERLGFRVAERWTVWVTPDP